MVSFDREISPEKGPRIWMHPKTVEKGFIENIKRWSTYNAHIYSLIKLAKGRDG